MNYINLADAFEATASLNSKSSAIWINKREKANYQDLNKLSDVFASFLIQHNLEEQDTVAIFHNKTVRAYALMIACLKCGVPYINLDAKIPEKRLKLILEQCKPSFLFHNSESIEIGVANLGLAQCQTYYLDDTELLNSTYETNWKLDTLKWKVDGDKIAYIMFTSGSTGTPKGVAIKHSSVLLFISWMSHLIGVTNNDRVLALNPPYFDNSVFDFYISIFSGATLFPISLSLLSSPKELIKECNARKVSIWFSVPSLIIFILKMKAITNDDLKSLRLMIFGGEGFPKASLRKLREFLNDGTKLLNVYGPTEGTCICSSYWVTNDDLKSDELLPLGCISPNFSYMVLDANQEPARKGEKGELWLGGPCIAAGYYGDIGRTKMAFLPVPGKEKANVNMYRTGDLVSVDPKNQQLHFLGRKDNQIKHMGFRIELEEIEFALGSINYVSESAVVYDNSLTPGRLIAFVACTSGQKPDIVKELRTILPYYMIPNELVIKDQLPKNSNGKTDKFKLLSSLK